MCSIENIQRLNKHKTSVSVYCILATVTYRTQMRNYTDTMALQYKDCGEKTTLKCKEYPKHNSILFFMREKIARLLIQKLSFLCFSGVATASNLFLSTRHSLPTCWYSSIPGIFSVVFMSWWKDSPSSSIIASKFSGK